MRRRATSLAAALAAIVLTVSPVSAAVRGSVSGANSGTGYCQLRAAFGGLDPTTEYTFSMGLMAPDNTRTNVKTDEAFDGYLSYIYLWYNDLADDWSRPNYPKVFAELKAGGVVVLTVTARNQCTNT